MSYFYFIDSELLKGAVKLDSGFFCFSNDEFESLKCSDGECFFRVVADSRGEAIDFFDGKKEFDGTIDIIRTGK